MKVFGVGYVTQTLASAIEVSHTFKGLDPKALQGHRSGCVFTRVSPLP